MINNPRLQPDEQAALAACIPTSAVNDWDIAGATLERLSRSGSGSLAVLDRIAGELERELNTHGFTVLQLGNLFETWGSPSSVGAVTAILSLLGKPLRVFRSHPFWKPIGVDLSRPLDASGGVGLQSFHIDFVNAENPPDLVYLLCVRPDPYGGGDSLVAPLAGIEHELSPRFLEVLSETVFTDGQVVNLDGIGCDINPFAVLPKEGRWKYRYTSKLLTTTSPLTETAVALRAMHAAIEARGRRLHLSEGDLLILDQHRVAHGRGALGTGQESLRPEERRMLRQAFARRE